MRTYIVFLASIGLVALAACGTVSSTPPPAVSPAGPALTREAVLNVAYQPSETLLGPFPLRDGFFADDGARISVQMLDDWIVFGDLNADGNGDAAALVTETYGGSGVFLHLVVFLNEGGRPVQLAPVLLGDRVQPEGLEMDGGQVAVSLLVHGPVDALCCPTQPVQWTYLLRERRLILTRVTSQTPGGALRAITIREPAFGASVAAQTRLAGDCTIAPFENNLVYRIYGPDETLLAEGPLTVSAPDLGAPGTFDALLDLSALPAGILRIEVLDLSAADGSTLASDSVFVLR